MDEKEKATASGVQDQRQPCFKFIDGKLFYDTTEIKSYIRLVIDHSDKGRMVCIAAPIQFTE